jgi:hypothetical protein
MMQFDDLACILNFDVPEYTLVLKSGKCPKILFIFIPIFIDQNVDFETNFSNPHEFSFAYI